MKRKRFYIFLILLGLMLVAYLESRAPQPLDKTPSFSRFDKIPFGSYVLFACLEDIFAGNQVISNELPLKELLSATPNDSLFNLIFIDRRLDFDEFDTRLLLDAVGRGANVFLAAENLSGNLADTLEISTNFFADVLADSQVLQFTSPFLQNDSGYAYRHDNAAFYFTRFDTSRATVLAENAGRQATLLRYPQGKGQLLISSNPFAYTNYNMLLNDNAGYVSKSLSYLPPGMVVWDEYYKARRKEIRTPLRYVLSQPPLKRAYVIALAGIVLFIVFQGRRRQRIIPVISPLHNTTLEFVKTVGRLYYFQRDHKKMAEKKIIHFLDYLREHFRINIAEMDAETLSVIAQKTGRDAADVQRLFTLIRVIRDLQRINETDLLSLSHMIDSYYTETATKKPIERLEKP